MALFTDAQIASLLNERKPVSPDFYTRIDLKIRGAHKGWGLPLTGEEGNEFVIIVRVNMINVLDFSVILAYEPKGSNQRVLLRRYNGKSHQHSNRLEKQPAFYDFHIHTATERYQQAGMKEEHYAETTERYANWREALDCLIEDCNVAVPPGGPSLFSTL